jgi:hypothetical protein
MISKPTKYESFDIPNEYICPLTLEIMVNPLMDRYGRSYERSAILEWIASTTISCSDNDDNDNGPPTCPITRRPLYAKDLIPNNKLRNEILLWREAHGDDITTEEIMMDNVVIIEQELQRALTVWGKLHSNHIAMKEQQQRRPSRRCNHNRWIRMFSSK